MRRGPFASVAGNGSSVGDFGVSFLTGQPHGAKSSVVLAEQDSVLLCGYGQDWGRHPSSSRQVLDTNNLVSSLVMNSACTLCLSGWPTTVTVTGIIPSTVSTSLLATLIMVVVGQRFFSVMPICLMRLIPAQSTEAPVSAIPVDLVCLALALSGTFFGSGWSCSQWSSCGLIITWIWLELSSFGLSFHFLLCLSNTRLYRDISSGCLVNLTVLPS